MGSPPRMRGKAVAIFRQLHHGRITPAYAGKSFGACIADAVPPGSPPRVRGKVIADAPDPDEMRITPAYAGKRPAASAARSAKWDHPRVCGEKFRFILLSLLSSGSPPRVRGKGVVHVFVPEKLGITPAYAGKSFMWTKFCRETRDHPRVCGEKGKNHPRKPYCEGLPPRVRGKGALHHIQR